MLRLRTYVVVLLLCSHTQLVSSATPAQVEVARNKGLAWLVKNQSPAGGWKSAPGLQVQATAAAVEALARFGMKPSAAFGAGVSRLSNLESSSVDSEARKLMALSTTGVDMIPYVSRLLAKGNANNGAWGTYRTYVTSFPDTPLALTAIRQSRITYATQTDHLRNVIFCEILPGRRGTTGWSFTKPGTLEPTNAQGAAVLPTALTVFELNASKTIVATPFPCSGTSIALQTAIDQGVTWLLTKRNADGGFGDSGTSQPLLTTAVYRAFAALPSPPQPATDGAIDYLIAQQSTTTGGWQEDAFLTASALMTFPPTTLTDTDKDGLPDAVEAHLGTNPAVADGRNLIPGNGQGTLGLNSPIVLAQGNLGLFFSHTIQASGGVAPYTYLLATGSLPNGLALSGSGLINGVPAVVGPFNFEYQVADSVGSTTRVVGRIDVVQVAGSGGSDGEVPTLPEWGVILMACLLLASMHHLRRKQTASRR